jgi:diacylglycerol kinase (ATP)
MKLKLISNPAAGRGRAGRMLRRALQLLRAGGAEVEHAVSSSPGHLTDLAAEASRHDYDRVVICGGDGTLNFAVREFDLGRGTLALLPLGSGDDFARVVGIPRSLKHSCQIALTGEPRSVDVAVVNGTRFLGVAGFGFDSEVNAFANERVRHLSGSLVYLYAIFRVLPKFQPFPMRLSIDGVLRNEEVMFIAVGNSRQYGGGIRITPAAKVDDGILDYTIVHRCTRLKLLQTLPKAYIGTHVRSSFVETGVARQVSIDSDNPFDLYADGERITSAPATISLEPQRLRIIVPKRTWD